MKVVKKLLIIFSIPFFLYAQKESNMAWVVKDRDFGREFLRTYIDVFTQANPMADLEIQETDEIRISVNIQEDGTVNIDKLYAKSRGGALNKLDEEILNEMDPELIQRLKERKYNWDSIAQFEVGAATGEIINVFQERNYKQCRDAFWWTHRRVDITALPRIILRINPKWALSMEFGREDIGFPANASRNLNIGLATEVFKFHITMPSGYPFLIGKQHPLDGSYGAGLKFDTPKFGGSISFQDMKFRSNSEELIFPEPENIVYNSFSGQIYYSFTNRIGASEDKPGFKLPLGSLRMLFGASFSQFAYGYADSTAKYKFIERDRSKPLELLQGIVRAEYTSDMNERFFNTWKFGSQINVGLTGFGSIQFYLSRTIMEWFGINLTAAFFWTGIEFDATGNPYQEAEKFTYNPGWYIIPSISIYF